MGGVVYRAPAGTATGRKQAGIGRLGEAAPGPASAGCGAPEMRVGNASEDRRAPWPGGDSGVLSSPFHANLLPRWLTNDTYPVRQRRKDIVQNRADDQTFVPEG